MQDSASMGFQIPRYKKLLDAYSERMVRILGLLESGVSQSAIAKQEGISRARVNQIDKKRKAKVSA